jgi:hypothetical protein
MYHFHFIRLLPNSIMLLRMQASQESMVREHWPGPVAFFLDQRAQLSAVALSRLASLLETTTLSFGLVIRQLNLKNNNLEMQRT